MKLVRSGLINTKPNRSYFQVGGPEFTTLLIHKSYEELHEVAEQMLMREPSKDHLAEEMADLIEVLFAIADWFEIDMETVEDIRNLKLEGRGGFTERWVVS